MRLLAAIFLSLSFTLNVYALSEEEKVNSLIKRIEKSDAVFIRNGSEHTAKEASKHLKFKYERATSSFFFFSASEEVTAERFIRDIASKSSTSGKPYFIKFKGEDQIPTEVWLKKQLRDIEENKEKVNP